MRHDEDPDLERARAPFEAALRILGTLEPERLHEEVLAALAGAAGAQEAALWVVGDEGALALRAWRGLVDGGALAARLEPGAALAAEPPRRARPEEGGAPAGAVICLPLTADGEQVGLALLERPALGEFTAAGREAAAGLAKFAAVALRNARRFQAARRESLRDPETGAYQLAYFLDYAGKELDRARRYGRCFSLAVLSVDDLEALRAAAGCEPLRAATRALVTAVSRAARDADALARASDGEYYLLLPETDWIGALVFARRAGEEIRREEAVRALDARGHLRLAIGAATFPRDGEGIEDLLRECRARQTEARASLLRRLDLELEPASFWDLADTLLGGAPLPPEAASARLTAAPNLFADVQREVAREIGRDPRQRTALYVGVSGGASEAPVAAALPPLSAAARAGDAGARVFVLGRRGASPGREPAAHPLLTPVFVDGDKRLEDHRFLLLLREDAAYALLQGPGGRAFHSSDTLLVDFLVSRLQTQYDLDPI
jgi:two-component system cell cycle response regulator